MTVNIELPEWNRTSTLDSKFLKQILLLEEIKTLCNQVDIAYCEKELEEYRKELKCIKKIVKQNEWES